MALEQLAQPLRLSSSCLKLSTAERSKSMQLCADLDCHFLADLQHHLTKVPEQVVDTSTLGLMHASCVESTAPSFEAHRCLS